MINPFEVFSPEQLSIPKFKEIFVKEYTEVSMFESPKDHFIIGSRGCGKSMLLNYMELSHQLSYYEMDFKKFKDSKKNHAFIGIMVHATKQRLNVEQYEELIENHLEKSQFVKSICMHDLIMAILQRVVKTLLENPSVLFYINNVEKKSISNLCKEIITNLNFESTHHVNNFDDVADASDALNRLLKVFTRERHQLSDYVNNRLQSKPNLFYSGNFCTFELLSDMIIELKKILQLPDYSFYFLMDNADEMKNTMQLCVDELVRQREHMDYCFKIAIKKGVNWDFGSIEEPHDYSSSVIDELYSTKNSLYAMKMCQIAAKRMESAGINQGVRRFFPRSAKETELLTNIKQELKAKYAQEYPLAYKNGKTHLPLSKFVNNRVNKYAQAELFRRLKRTKKSYAGFSNMVHLSSGIVRQFLELASKMYDEQVRKTPDIIPDKISLSIQNDVIKDYADEDMDQLKDQYESLERSEALRKSKKQRDTSNYST